jgi:NAD(P)H-hydrate epimerase
LDADGINALSGNIDILDMASCPVILTPHDGEYARLGGDLSSGNRLPGAVSFAARHNCIIVLKGHRTITALPDGSAYCNASGSPALAKGGTGDALAGMMLGLLGQGFAVKDAVLSAVYLHGLAGEICASRYGEYSLTPKRLLDAIPDAVKSVCKMG